MEGPAEKSGPKSRARIEKRKRNPSATSVAHRAYKHPKLATLAADDYQQHLIETPWEVLRDTFLVAWKSKPTRSWNPDMFNWCVPPVFKNGASLLKCPDLLWQQLQLDHGFLAWTKLHILSNPTLLQNALRFAQIEETRHARKRESDLALWASNTRVLEKYQFPIGKTWFAITNILDKTVRIAGPHFREVAARYLHGTWMVYRTPLDFWWVIIVITLEQFLLCADIVLLVFEYSTRNEVRDHDGRRNDGDPYAYNSDSTWDPYEDRVWPQRFALARCRECALFCARICRKTWCRRCQSQRCRTPGDCFHMDL